MHVIFIGKCHDPKAVKKVAFIGITQKFYGFENNHYLEKTGI